MCSYVQVRYNSIYIYVINASPAPVRGSSGSAGTVVSAACIGGLFAILPESTLGRLSKRSDTTEQSYEYHTIVLPVDDMSSRCGMPGSERRLQLPEDG